MLKKRWKLILVVFIALLALWGYKAYTSLSDLRPKQAYEMTAGVEARELVAQMGLAHKISSWSDFDTYSVTFEDEFYGFIGEKSTPFAEAKSSFQLDYINNTYDGRLQVLEGQQKGEIWGLQSWKAYKKLPDESLDFQEDATINFWLPTYQYFIELPRAIQTATVMEYIGRREVDGVPCDGVMVSWGTLEPQENIDQYLLWIEAASKRLVAVEYTVRDAYAFLTGVAHYKEYKEYEGVVLPQKMTVESNIVRDGYLHEMRIKNFRKNLVSIETLRPDSSLAPVIDKPKM